MLGPESGAVRWLANASCQRSTFLVMEWSLASTRRRAAVALQIDVDAALSAGGTRELAARFNEATKSYSVPRQVPIDIEALMEEQLEQQPTKVQEALKAIATFELRVRQGYLPMQLQLQDPDEGTQSLHPLVQGPTAFGGGPGTGGPPSDVGLSPTAPTQGDSPDAP